MPDNSTLPATGDVIAADEIGGVKFQRAKLTLGADGVNDGDVSKDNPMPARMTGDQATLDVTFPMVVEPINGNPELSTTGSVRAKIVPGGVYTFCLSTKTTLGTVANTLSNCGTIVSSTSVSYTGTAPVVGQLLAGTGITPGTYVKSVTPGTGFVMSLPATATGTVTLNVTAGFFTGIFEASTDGGSTWSQVNVTPRGFQFDSGKVNAANAPGLFQYQARWNDTDLRFTIQTIGLTGVAGNATAHSVVIGIDALDRTGSITSFPTVTYIAATATTFPTGIPVIMPVDMTGFAFASLGVQTLSGTSQTITWRQTNDHTGIGFQGLSAIQTQVAAAVVGASTTTAGEYALCPTGRYLYAAMTGGSAVTSMVLTGCSSHTGTALGFSQIAQTLAAMGINVVQINGQTMAVTAFNGASQRGMTNGVAGPVSNADYAAQAWAAASGSGATIADATGAGLGVAFDVSLTAWTAGSSLGLTVYLQESPDNGTTWYDIWQCEELTGVSRARIPAIPIGGRRRMRWVNRGGAATTATVTVTCMDLSGWPIKQVQWFDRTAGATSGTVTGANGAAYDIAGMKAMTCAISAGTAGSAASFKVQMSTNGIDWYDASAPVSCPANALTLIPLTAGVYGRFARFVPTANGTTAVINYGSIYGTN